MDSMPVNNLDTQLTSGNTRRLSFSDALEEAGEALTAAGRLERGVQVRGTDLRIKLLLAEAQRMIDYAEGLL